MAGIIYFEPLSRKYNQKHLDSPLDGMGDCRSIIMCHCWGYQYEEWRFVLWIYIYTLSIKSMHKMVDILQTSFSKNVWYGTLELTSRSFERMDQYGIGPDIHPDIIRIQWMSSAPGGNGFICCLITFRYGLCHPDDIVVFRLDEISCYLHDISCHFHEILFRYISIVCRTLFQFPLTGLIVISCEVSKLRDL